MNVAIRTLSEGDFSAADILLKKAFNNPADRQNDLKLSMRLQPDGWLGAFFEGQLVGTVYAVRYDTFAHIGFMVIDPPLQGQGLGRVLMQKMMDYLRDHQVTLITLDASPAGHQFYPKLGFIDQQCTLIYGRHIQSCPLVLPAHIHPIGTEDLEEILQVDRPIFGADRRKVFQGLLEQFSGRAFLSRDDHGNVNGYIFAQMNRIGPWVASKPEEAQLLIDTILTLPYDDFATIVVPEECKASVLILEQTGFERIHSGWHMFKGEMDLKDQRGLYYAQTSQAIG